MGALFDNVFRKIYNCIMLKNLFALIDSIQPLTIILALYGLLMAVAAFRSSGVYYFCCALLLAASIILHVIDGGDIAQVFFMLFFMLAALTVCYILSVRFSKYGWMLRVPLNEKRMTKDKEQKHDIIE